jgi:hypothetical protein
MRSSFFPKKTRYLGRGSDDGAFFFPKTSSVTSSTRFAQSSSAVSPRPSASAA